MILGERFKSKPSSLVIQRLFQLLAWVLVVGIVSLSIVPSDYRVVTDLPRPLEHLAVFLLTGLAFVFGYPGRCLFQCVGLSLFAAAIELLQLWVPGRHARLSDFIAGFAGVILGTGLGYLSTKLAWGKLHEEKNVVPDSIVSSKQPDAFHGEGRPGSRLN